MSVPKISEWGPKYWKFLHGIIEKIGSRTLKKLQEDDEARYAFQLLNAVVFSLPCIQCRKHYKEWLTQYPLRRFFHLRGVTLRLELRRWLWELHSNINREKNTVIQPALEDIENLYKDIDILLALKDIPITSTEMKEVRKIAQIFKQLY